MTDEELESTLNELILLGEREWIEFKENNHTPDLIGEYISALSNSACIHNKEHGYLVFGVEDKTYKVVGTGFKHRNEKASGQELENYLHVHLNSGNIDFTIYEFEYNDSPIVLFKIAATTNTPVEFKRESFIRIGSYKKRLKDHPEKERQIWSKVPNATFEKDFAIKGIDKKQLLELINHERLFQLFGYNKTTNENGIIDVLKSEQIIVAKNGRYSITNMGAILFARQITAFPELSRKTIRLIFYSGKDKLNAKKEIDGSYGYAVGFEGLIKYIDDHLPSNEIINQALRQVVKLYPQVAIRELVANALIHQDFYATGTSPMIEVYSNRIEITNPGQPLVNTLRFIDHSPQSRNEKIAKVMRRIKICEERGSGIDRVVSECEKFQLPAPEFIAGEDFTKAIIYGPLKLNEMRKEDKIRTCYQHCVLKFITSEKMTNQTVRERFSIKEENAAIASRIIKETVEAKLIKEESPNSNSRKYVRYIPFWA